MFGPRIEIVRLYGIPIRLDASWLLIALLISWTLAAQVFPAEFPKLTASTYWAMGIAAALGLFVSILLHELSHSLVARRFGIVIGGITLFIFGGVAEMESEPPTARSEFLMAIAGPIASFAISAVLFLAGAAFDSLPAPVLGVISYLALINLLLAGFNMLPAFPLDGGRVFRAALWGTWNDFPRATRAASTAGRWGGGILIAVGAVFALLLGNIVAGIWWIVIGLFLRGAAQSEVVRLEISTLMSGHTVGDFMTHDPISVDSAATVQKLVTDYLYRHHYGAYPVVDGANTTGIVGLKQIKIIPEAEWGTTTVKEILVPLTADMVVSSKLPAMEALQRLQKAGETRLVVVDSGTLVGIVTLADLMSVVGLMLDLQGRSQ